MLVLQKAALADREIPTTLRPCGVFSSRGIDFSHLGSDICADCLTRPQYVDRSYCEAGSSRLPSSEADMLHQCV